MLWGSNFEIVTIPVSKNGFVQIYDIQNPEKLEMQTRGTRINRILRDSPLRFKNPEATNENIKIGNMKTIRSLRSRLVEYRWAFTETSIYSPMNNARTNRTTIAKGRFKNFLSIRCT
jgi:hypothetical protein